MRKESKLFNTGSLFIELYQIARDKPRQNLPNSQQRQGRDLDSTS